LAIAALVAGTAVPRAADAQSLPAFDARTWRPPTDPAAGMVLEPVTAPGSFQWNVGGWAWYAEKPVIVHGGSATQHPVEHQAGMDAIANVGLGARFALGVDVPVYFWQHGQTGSLPTTGVGDVSLLAKATVVSNDKKGLRAGLGLAALAEVALPTGSRSSFMGDGAATVSLRWLVEYSLGVGAVRASAGFLLRPDWRSGFAADDVDVTVGDALPWSIGLTVRPKAFLPAADPGDRQEWELAAHGSLPAGPVAPFGWGGGGGATALSPALLAFSDRVAIDHYRDAYLVAGADLGLDTAIGVPAIRAVVGVGWAPRVHDRDADGVPDDVDQCPDLPEDRDGIQDRDGCPEDDADSDGIPDEEDACPLVPGVESSDPKRNGCAGAPPPEHK
jgi:hypothetical protein